MKTGIAALLILAVTNPARAQSSWPQGSRTVVPFEVSRPFSAIIISARVNGHPATLVVDTGCSNTILRSDLLQIRPLALDLADAPAKGSGYTGTAAWAKATVQVGSVTWQDHRLLVMNDFEELSRSMKEKVDGILGQDLLREFDSVMIDFKHRQLILR